MMRIFNALQLVGLFAAMPFLVQYTKDANFYAHTVLFWVLIVAYLAGFGAMVGLVADNIDK